MASLHAGAVAGGVGAEDGGVAVDRADALKRLCEADGEVTGPLQIKRQATMLAASRIEKK